jgi:hypothetical protein
MISANAARIRARCTRPVGVDAGTPDCGDGLVDVAGRQLQQLQARFGPTT